LLNDYARASKKEDKKRKLVLKLEGRILLKPLQLSFRLWVVNCQIKFTGTLQNNKLISRESVTGSFGEGFRTGLTACYRFNSRVGLEMGVNYYASQKQWRKQLTD
jgi:hypothetical protein